MQDKVHIPIPKKGCGPFHRLNMHLLYSVIENLLVMILSVAVLAGGIYLLLLLLHFWLRFKSAGREEQGLSEIWEDIRIRDKINEKRDHPEE